MRRWVIVLTLSVFLTLLTGVGAAASIALFGPFDLNDGKAYQSQRRLEEIYVKMVSSPTGRAEKRITLAERRIHAAEDLAGGMHEYSALVEMDQSIQDAVRAASSCPQSDSGMLRVELLAMLQHAGQVFRYLEVPAEFDMVGFQRWSADVMRRLRQPDLQLVELSAMLGDPETSIVSEQNFPAPVDPTATPSWVNPHIVYFQAGSAGAKHQFYLLVGRHEEIDCTGCHTQGKYMGIDKFCESCHRSQQPAEHYPGKCELCHIPTLWTDIHYEHVSPNSDNCSTCHQKVMPTRHYPGQCSACHTTTAWTPTTFDHAVAQVTECLSCHTVHRPEKHWNGECSLCHSTEAWFPATFNHSAVGATDCQACHGRPSGHWGGQCSACHSTSAWRPATFNHAAAGATDCIACHSNRRPANHYDGQCSSCHSTSAWKPANFNHGFPMNHGGAKNNCATCHPSGTSSWTCFNCHDKGEMDKKHNEKDISNYASRCLSCHPNGEEDDD
jgi:hypothetical protein